jgi:hypothetical protein
LPSNLCPGLNTLVGFDIDWDSDSGIEGVESFGGDDDSCLRDGILRVGLGFFF